MTKTGGTTGSTVDRNGITHRKGIAKVKDNQSKDYIDPFESEDNIRNYIESFDFASLNNFLQEKKIRSLTCFEVGYRYKYNGRTMTFDERVFLTADDDNKQEEIQSEDNLFDEIAKRFLQSQSLSEIRKIDIIVPEDSDGELAITPNGDKFVLNNNELYLELNNPDIAVKEFLDMENWNKWSKITPTVGYIPKKEKDDIWSLVETSSEYEGLPPLTPERLEELKKNGLETIGLNHDEEEKLRLMEAYEYVRLTKPETIGKDLLIKLFNIMHNSAESNYRDTSVYLGGNHFPPKPNKLDGFMDALNNLTNDTAFQDPYYKAASQHIAFESIHPFADGNGRIGRLLLDEIVFGNGLNFKNGTRVSYQASLRACERLKSPEPLANWFKEISTRD